MYVGVCGSIIGYLYIQLKQIVPSSLPKYLCQLLTLCVQHAFIQ